MSLLFTSLFLCSTSSAIKIEEARITTTTPTTNHSTVMGLEGYYFVNEVWQKSKMVKRVMCCNWSNAQWFSDGHKETYVYSELVLAMASMKRSSQLPPFIGVNVNEKKPSTSTVENKKNTFHWCWCRFGIENKKNTFC